MKVPKTLYAKTPDGLYIAYQDVGTGSIPLVFFNGMYSHIEIYWEWRQFARFVERLALQDAHVMMRPAVERWPPVRRARGAKYLARADAPIVLPVRRRRCRLVQAFHFGEHEARYPGIPGEAAHNRLHVRPAGPAQHEHGQVSRRPGEQRVGGFPAAIRIKPFPREPAREPEASALGRGEREGVA